VTADRGDAFEANYDGGCEAAIEAGDGLKDVSMLGGPPSAGEGRDQTLPDATVRRSQG